VSKSGEVAELSATPSCVLGARVHLAEGMLGMSVSVHLYLGESSTIWSTKVHVLLRW
jgi:hypothetical protein